jgi:ATP-dependent Lon protease
LVSLALNKPAVRELAMTGEITLSGTVSAIGGVKEKTMGAKREGITLLIFPEENKRDVEELSEEIKEGMTFIYARHFFDVMEIVFDLKIKEANAAAPPSA